MITGIMLRDAVISAANHIAANKQAVDELNVFPVPDGDTGTNMSMTISAAARELSLSSATSVGDIAEIIAGALLRGARGNSGVILSLLFRGFAAGLKGLDEADGRDLAKALAKGVESAYKAVMKPTEGTILTVARVAAERSTAMAEKTTDAVEVFTEILSAAKAALETTPELLPVLKKAGVVDAGGKGLVMIFEGMLSVFKEGVMIQAAAEGTLAATPSAYSQKNAAAEWEGEITFTYCTEFIVKRDNLNKDYLALRAYLESIGDSAVVVADDTIIKVHVHTDHPGNALQKGLKYGQLINIKIENMRQQHETAVQEAKSQKPAEETEVSPAPKTNPYGFVAVAAGDGLKALFADLGVDNVVSGGQTMNPSTEDILKAVESTPAETVFVLPNNKNIIMAAEQAIPLATRKVFVLHTRTVPQGISAMLAFDPEQESETILMAMMKASEQVSSGAITFAARNSDYEGKKIKEGELLALENGKLAFTDTDMIRAVARLCKNMYKKTSSFVTLIYGEGVTEEKAEEAKSVIQSKLPDAEITVINGGQPVYYFLLSVE